MRIVADARVNVRAGAESVRKEFCGARAELGGADSRRTKEELWLAEGRGRDLHNPKEELWLAGGG